MGAGGCGGEDFVLSWTKIGKGAAAAAAARLAGNFGR